MKYLDEFFENDQCPEGMNEVVFLELRMLICEMIESVKYKMMLPETRPEEIDDLMSKIWAIRELFNFKI